MFSSCFFYQFAVKYHYSVIEQWMVNTLNDNSFFKPTLLYKEFMILDLIEKDANITQREISEAIGVAVSMVNSYLDDYEKKGLIKRKKYSTKTVEYFLTKKGKERKKVLNISYLSDSLKVFKSASQDIIKFINQILEKGFKKVLLYGAGEVAEILLQTLTLDNDLPIEVVGVIDDDINKLGTSLIGTNIVQIESVNEIEHDGILISSYTNREAIMEKLLNRNYSKNNILNFFEN